MSRDLLSELSNLPDLLRKKVFRQVKVFNSETVHLWTCVIEYGNGDFVEGFGVAPDVSMENALNTLYEYIKDDMPKMDQRAILEKYDPKGLRLIDERWEQV